MVGMWGADLKPEGNGIHKKQAFDPAGCDGKKKERETMSKRTCRIMLVLIVMGYILIGTSSMALAQEESSNGFSTGLFDARGAAAFGATIGAGLVIIGGAKGISRIGGSAVESMARQPEASGSINVAMIITAAMIEGATLFAVIVCLLALP